MSILLSVIKKEARHITRDARTMTITLFIPVVLLLLFGFAISTEVNDVRIATVSERYDCRTREIIEKLSHNPYFTFKGEAEYSDIERMLRRGEIDAALVLRGRDNAPEYQIITDGSNTNIAQTAAFYIENVLRSPEQDTVLIHTLYNPQLKSAYNFVPGIMGMIFILICAMMTSVSIVREKESGTMDLMFVSPVRPSVIVIGKLIPYFILSCILLVAMLCISYMLLELPFYARVINVAGLSLLYIILSLALGLLISSLVRSQVAALLVSCVVLMLPVIMLSGMIFPIDNMPYLLRMISCIIPARWYISAMRAIMIQQLPFQYILRETIILAVMTMIIISIAVRKTSKQK